MLFALFVWWFSTGVIVYLDGLRRDTSRWTILGATMLFGLALYGLWVGHGDTSVSGTYMAFACGLILWDWKKVCFLMADLTGPRKEPCLLGCGGWRHVGRAIQTILYHELGLLASPAVQVALTWASGTSLVCRSSWCCGACAIAPS